MDVECSVNATHFASGFNNVVLAVGFSDNIRWIARVPYRDFADSDRVSMLSEIATMALIKNNTTITTPCIFDFEASADQKLGYPYMLMSACLAITFQMEW